MKIAVLLCTYNGDKYLSQQIDSLLDQTFKDFHIYIHDDGSTDNTNSIIKEYEIKYVEKISVLDDPIKGRGAKNSFMWLLSKVHADYYMFCDQDDIWLKNKIEDTYNRLLEVENININKPVVIHTDLTLIDKNQNLIHKSYWNYTNKKVDISKNFKYLWFGNVVTGCTMIFNNRAKELSLALTNNYVEFHDYWIALVVAKYGVVENLKKQTILYRQHENNVVGCGEKIIGTSIKPKKSIIEWIKWYKNNENFLKSLNHDCFLKVTWDKIVHFILFRISK